MSEKPGILVVLEPDHHPQEVVARAAWLAHLTDCRLHLLLCDPDAGPLREGFFVSNEAREIGEKIHAAREAIVEDLASSARDAGLDVTTEVLSERPIADGVMHRAVDMDPAYVVKGTEYHSVAERSILLQTDWQLIRSCPYPLWLVKPREMRDKPVIMAAVDPTHEHDKPAALDQVIIDHAQKIAAAAEGEVHLVHVYQRLVGVGREATRTFKPIELPIDEIAQRIQKEHREKLDALADANGIGSEFRHQLPGDTRDLLPMFARTHNVDLVAIGALARWGIKRAILGSTVERVLDHLPCDVLIVRSG